MRNRYPCMGKDVLREKERERKREKEGEREKREREARQKSRQKSNFLDLDRGKNYYGLVEWRGISNRRSFFSWRKKKGPFLLLKVFRDLFRRWC